MNETPDPTAPDVVYERMIWNTPLSEDHASFLLDFMGPAPERDILDLGCGWGELLLRALGRAPQAPGVGVDNAAWAIERGRRAAKDRGLSERVTFTVGDAAAWEMVADRLLCVGASHAWGGSVKALQTLRPLVPPGGRLIFGDGCWERPPSDEAARLFGDDVLGFATLVDHALNAGWRVLHVTTADQQEWDLFETTFRAGREAWLRTYPSDHRCPEVRAKLDDLVREYVSVYRTVLSFAYLVLA